MGKPLNHLNKKFHMLKVLERVDNDKHGKSMWLCECDCGRNKIVRGQELVREETTSCGCVASMTRQLSYYSKNINRDFEDEKFTFNYIVCNKKKLNLLAICKICGWNNYFRSSRIHSVYKHRCEV